MSNDPHKELQHIQVYNNDKRARVEIINEDLKSGRLRIAAPELPSLAHMAPAVAHELEQLALYLDKTVACDAMVQAEVSKHSIGRNDMNASLAQRLGAALGALEVAARNVRHQAKLLREAK